MNIVRFPDMLTNNKTAIVKDNDAILQGIKALLYTPKLSMLGDPKFGTNIHKLLYESNNLVLRDIIIDDIYSSIVTYIPQVMLERKDIKVYPQGNKVTAQIYVRNRTNNQGISYEINLLETEEV